MATAVVRNFSLYANGRKCGEATGIAYDQESGNEIQIGDGQVLGQCGAQVRRTGTGGDATEPPT